MNFELMILCCKLRHKVMSKTEGDPFIDNLASLVAQTVKHLPAMQETWVQILSWEDPLEKEMATYSSTLA